MAEHSGVAAGAGAGVGGDPDAAVTAALADVRAQVGGGPVTLAVVFLGSGYARHAERVRAAVADALGPQVLLGVVSAGVIAGGAELESSDSVVVWAAILPGAVVTPLRYPPAGLADAPTSWAAPPEDTAGLVLLADPSTFPTEAFTRWVDHLHPGMPVSGALSSGSTQASDARLLLDGEVLTDGAVAVALGGAVALTPLVSQGCKPIGEPFTVTRGERNVIAELGGEPAMERIRQVTAEADPADRQRLQEGLLIGLAVEEFRDHHGVGDFLVRPVVGADRERGAVAIGERVQLGQTVQLHVRDADTADRDLRRTLASAWEHPPHAALLFTCTARGSALFAAPDHDAGLVREALGDVALAGCFAAGEVGPVGGRNHVHTFTASLLVVHSRAAPL